MHELQIYLSILAVLLVGIMSPGPSFLWVARTTVATTRSHGVAAAAGMGVGGLFFALLVLLGLHSLLLAMPVLYLSIKMMGGLYLLFLAFQIFKGASKALLVQVSDVAQGSLNRSFSSALAIQLSNPKTLLYYASVFAALLPKGMLMSEILPLAVAIFLVEFSWYAAVAVALSTNGPRQAYLRSKRWIDYCASGLISLIAINLLIASLRDGF